MRLSTLITLSLCLFFSQASLSEHSEKKTVAETIPSTMANLRGHKALYEEGWFIVSSSEKALSYAKKHSINSSAEALKRLSSSVGQRSSDYKGDLISDVASSSATTKSMFNSGTKNTGSLLSDTHTLAQQQWAFSGETSSRAWETFSNGYIYLGKRTEESRNGLKSVPNDFYNGVKEDFSELASGIKEFNSKGSINIKENWADAFDNAHTEFQSAYQKSGEQSNSLTGLWTLLGGYISGLWQGLIKPTAKTAWQVTAYTVVVAGEAVFLPIASTYILTKNTLLSTGTALYYTGKTGIEIISPTVEGGFLASLALVSAGTIPVTYVAGTSVGVINQVGTTVAAPATGVAQGVISTTADTLKYGALVTYDALTATTKVFINQFKSGVVLGYNALTAIPSHLLLGTVNTAYFIVADGPKLAIASVKGRVSFNSENEQQASFEAGHMPVGTVVNLQSLQNNSDANVQIITLDPAVIQNVISNIGKDSQQ